MTKNQIQCDDDNDDDDDDDSQFIRFKCWLAEIKIKQ